MAEISVHSFWRAAAALAALCGLAIAVSIGSDAAMLAALVSAACAAPILVLRANAAKAAREANAARARMADFDRQIVEIVRRHATLLQRRKDLLAQGLQSGNLRAAWERDVAHFNEKLVLPEIGALRRGESKEEILDRVTLVVDEVLQKRARYTRAA